MAVVHRCRRRLLLTACLHVSCTSSTGYAAFGFALVSPLIRSSRSSQEAFIFQQRSPHAQLHVRSFTCTSPSSATRPATIILTAEATAGASAAAVSHPSIFNKTLVSIQDCLEAYDRNPSGIAFVDGSWYHRSQRNGRSEFEAGPRLPNARYVDMDDICATGPVENPRNLPHMMPSKELFAAAMDEFGISNDHHVVVYGRDGCVFTPRTWFLFQQMGHDQSRIHLMQGSLEEWVDNGGLIDEAGPVTVAMADTLDLTMAPRYRARDPANIIDMAGVLEAVNRQPNSGGDSDDDSNSNSEYILDPRGTTFAKAHMPGAINIPYRSIVQDDDLLKFRSKEELQQIFDEAGVDVKSDRRIILTCGSGVSVCHLWCALEECGRDHSEGKTVVYDGSWAEWGIDESTPKVVFLRCPRHVLYFYELVSLYLTNPNSLHPLHPSRLLSFPSVLSGRISRKVFPDLGSIGGDKVEVNALPRTTR